MIEPRRIVTVVLIIDDPDLAKDMNFAVRGAGLDVERLAPHVAKDEVENSRRGVFG